MSAQPDLRLTRSPHTTRVVSRRSPHPIPTRATLLVSLALAAGAALAPARAAAQFGGLRGMIARTAAQKGWVVRRGAELKPPGHGPLAVAVVVDTAGRVRLVPNDSVDAVREAGGVREAFQTYPALLLPGGEVPTLLRHDGPNIDLADRDSRLAIGRLRDGRLLLALTRFDALSGPLSQLPVGLTVPEMAALMGALGCETAALLDGGISGQLLLRDGQGGVHAWRGWRDVPLGLVAVAR